MMPKPGSAGKAIIAGELALAGVKKLVHPLCGSRCATTVLSILLCSLFQLRQRIFQRCKVKMRHLCFFERRDEAAGWIQCQSVNAGIDTGIVGQRFLEIGRASCRERVS